MVIEDEYILSPADTKGLRKATHKTKSSLVGLDMDVKS